jgi:hypothetical protein
VGAGGARLTERTRSDAASQRRARGLRGSSWPSTRISGGKQPRERDGERKRSRRASVCLLRRPSYFWSFHVLTVWNFHVATSENPAKRRAETDDTTSLLNCHTQCGQDTESQEGDAPPIDKDLHFCSPVFRFSSGWSTPATENRGGTGSLLDLEELDLEDEGRVGGDDGREATLATVGTGHDQQV